MEKKIPVVIDCDPGTDDAIAILMMMGCPQYDIVGICPVNGNKPLNITEKNALMLMEVCDRADIPVLKGADKGMLVEKRDAGDIHGGNGLGGVELPEPAISVKEQYAWDFLYEQACRFEGELEVLAIGPLTNIGIAILKYPDIVGKIKRVTIMGGAFGGGNTTATAEFNIWVDPHGAKVVFDSGLNIAMMGLDICETAYLTEDDVNKLSGTSKAVCFAKELMSSGLRRMKEFGRQGIVMCDATAAFHMICPGGMSSEELRVDVETKGIITEGTTIATRSFTEHVRFVPNCIAGIKVDREIFAKTVIESINNLG